MAHTHVCAAACLLAVLGRAVCAAASGAGNGGVAETPGDISLCHGQPGWVVTFEDTFDDAAATGEGCAGSVVAGLNTSNWAVQDNMTHGPTEKQLYVARGVSVRNGTLVLTTRAEPATGPQGQPYAFTSGWVESRGLRWQQHGRFEVRARLPSPAVGRAGMWPTAWPAHWLMPEPTQTEPPNVCWPVGGEVDIMEGFRPRAGGDNRPLYTSVLQTYHWARNCNEDLLNTSLGFGPGFYPPANDNATLMDFTDWHTYTVDWTDASLVWFVDGKQVHRRDAGVPESLFTPPFPMYMILNTALTPWANASLDGGLPAEHVVDRVTWCSRIAAAPPRP